MTGPVRLSTAVPALRKGWRPPPEQQARSERTRIEDPTTPLQRISLELSRQCNLRCTFCYSQATAKHRVGLTDDEVRAVIDEAVALGACLISIVGGGESLLRRTILRDGESCIDYANRRGCYCVVYTNCTLVDRSAARWLRDRDVTVVGKLLSLRDSVQDSLVGVAGASLKIRRGVDALIEAGLSTTPLPRLALESVICRDNYDEMPDMWRWMRARGIVPEVEIPTFHGRATENCGALFFNEVEAPDKYRQLFEELLAIDRAEFGYDWIPHPPFVACSCQLYYSNCYVTDRGEVQPCASVDRVYGNLRVGPEGARGQPLSEIVTSAEFLKLRRIHEHLKGACKRCDLLHTCYGCRAAAWHKTGDVFAEDPVCWRRHPTRTKARSA
jgi:radical SAM protein with 4Fe4S-binding SPASM domain